MKFACPACGAEVQFKSKSSIFGVCSFCDSTLVRHDLNLEAIGKMGELAADLSPLQLGTLGRYDGAQFEIVGRQKISWESGAWSEWYLLFDDGRDGWLADAQGMYMISFQVTDAISVPKNLKVDQVVAVRGVNYRVNDLREVTCTGSQGELPVKGVIGRKSLSADLTADGGLFGNIDIAASETRVFLGKYREFDELKFMNLRELDGW